MDDETLNARAESALDMCKLFDYVVERDYGDFDVVQRIKLAKRLDKILEELVSNLPDFNEEESVDLTAHYKIDLDNEAKSDLQNYFLSKS